MSVSDAATNARCRITIPNSTAQNTCQTSFASGVQQTLNDATQSSPVNVSYCGDGTRNCGEACDPGIDRGCQATCAWETTQPASKITNISSTPGFAPNIPTTGAYSAFLKADNNGDTSKTYILTAQFNDEVGGSGLDKCYFFINGAQKEVQPCSGQSSSKTFNFTVGKPATGAYCTAEENDTCKIKVWAQDKAGNKNDATSLERKIGYIIDNPLSTIEKDERKYNTDPIGFNAWDFGVDWTAPTAQ